MKSIEIQLSEKALLGIGGDPARASAELRAAAAAKLYELGRVSQEIAAEIAGMSRPDFITHLSRLRVPPLQETADEAFAAARAILGR